MVLNRGSNIFLLPSWVDGDRQPGSTLTLPYARPSFSWVGTPNKPHIGACNPMQTPILQRKWWKIVYFEKVSTNERDSPGHSASQYLFTIQWKRSQETKRERPLSLVNHCSCMQIQANIFGIYPVPALTQLLIVLLLTDNPSRSFWGRGERPHTHIVIHKSALRFLSSVSARPVFGSCRCD